MRKASALTLMLAVLFLVAAGSQILLSSANYFPDPGPDLPRIHIRSDGNIEPATAPIQRIGSLYRLASNIIMYTIVIQCDNIVLDGEGYAIEGNASRIKGYDDGNNGVIITERNNVTVAHVKFEKGETGVRMLSSSNITVIDNSFSNGIRMGVVAQDSTLVLIEANEFVNLQTDIGAPAIMLNAAESKVRNNFLTGSSYGIEIKGTNNVISANTLETILPIILDRADANAIVNNTITGLPASLYTPDQNYGGNEAIALFASSNSIISGNNITGFVNQAVRTVFSCSNNTVYGNYMANNGFAVTLQEGAVNNTFCGNTFAQDSCKVHIDDGVIASWDNGTIGNYWGDHNGTDNNEDGIGDTPYIINAFKWNQEAEGFVSYTYGQDKYPLMFPLDSENGTIVKPSNGKSPQDLEPIPFAPVIAALICGIILVGAGSLLYFKKYKPQEKK